MKDKLKISFYGACQEVTGSNFLLEYKDVKILIDCGFFQGSKINDERNKEPFSYDPKDIAAVIVTHAHLDHIGRVPKLIHSGFKGEFFSTAPTRDLSELMLIDSLDVLKKELKKEKKDDLIYSEEDVKKAMGRWRVFDYQECFSVGDFQIILRDAGHILGSAMVEVKIVDKKILFSGDLGNSPEPLLNNTEKIADVDYLVIESTYGDKIHETREDSDLRFERVIEDTINRGGVLMIPAFSLERTQMILFRINNLMEQGRIPKAPVFLDSPLSIKATRIYDRYGNYFNEEAKTVLLKKGGIFNFPNLRQTLSSEESKEIYLVKGPKIIVAGSGMCNGGRILRHLIQYLPETKNTLLFISYQVAGSLGRKLSEEEKIVNILGEKVIVTAGVENIEGYSSHPDKEKLYDFVKNSADSLKKIFVVHGELKSNLFFTQRLRDHLGLDAISPKYGQFFEIDI